MLSTNEIFHEAESLPAEDLALVVDSIDRQWAKIAQRRLEELRSGDVAAVPGEAVLSRLRGQKR